MSSSKCQGVVVPSWQVMKMPEDMTFESAAALPTVVLTALHAVNLVAWIWAHLNQLKIS